MYRYTELYKRTLFSKSIGVESSAPIKIVLASGSRLFLEGIRKILEDEVGIKIVTEASNCEEAAKRLTEVGVKFLFIDNRAFNLDYGELSDLINKKGSDTKVILLGNQDKNRINIPGVIYVTKKTGSSELIHIIKRAAAAP
jgi:DNA-binding NarL/FixJ family response regulator